MGRGTCEREHRLSVCGPVRRLDVSGEGVEIVRDLLAVTSLRGAL